MHGVLKMSVAFTEMDRASRDPTTKVYISKFLVDHEDGKYSVVMVGNGRGIASRLMTEEKANDLYNFVTSKKRFLKMQHFAMWKEVPVAMTTEFTNLQDAMFDRYEEGNKPQKVYVDFPAHKG